MGFDNISMLAVMGAAVAKYIFGALWLSPYLFGRAWLNELRLRQLAPERVRISRMTAAGVSLVTALAMAVIIDIAGLSVLGSLTLGLIIGAGFSVAGLSLQFVSEGRSFRLYMIYAGQYLGEAVLMAGIIGYFQ